MAAGIAIGPRIGEAVRSEHDDTVVAPVLGGVLGAMIGFGAGAIVTEALHGANVIVLDEE